MSRIEVDKGDEVYVKIPIPNSTAEEPYKIKKGIVVSSAARAAKVQVEGEPPDKPRHIPWSKLSRTLSGLKANGKSINKPRLTTTKPKDPKPEETEPEAPVEVAPPEIKAIDQDFNDWLSMGGEIVDTLKGELKFKLEDRDAIDEQIKALNEKRAEVDAAVKLLNAKIEKLSAVQKMLGD